MTTTETRPQLGGLVGSLAQAMVTWFETGVRQERMFAPDVFADLTLPHWRIQASGEDATYHVREDEHPFAGKVRVEALDRTARGFLLQFEERWVAEGQHWYCRELIHAVVADDWITELVVYCTGDWDEARQRRHATEVTLLRS